MSGNQMGVQPAVYMPSTTQNQSNQYMTGQYGGLGQMGGQLQQATTQTLLPPEFGGGSAVQIGSSSQETQILGQIISAVGQLLSRLASIFMGQSQSSSTTDLGSSITGLAKPGLSQMVPQDQTQGLCSSTQNQSVEAAGEQESSFLDRIGSWIDKGVEWGNGVSSTIDWIGEKKDSVFSAVSNVWDSITEFFGWNSAE